MKKALSITAIALMMAGSAVYACSSCGCEPKKADPEKTECGSSCDKDESQTACGGSSHKGDDHKKAA